MIFQVDSPSVPLLYSGDCTQEHFQISNPDEQYLYCAETAVCVLQP